MPVTDRNRLNILRLLGWWILAIWLGGGIGWLIVSLLSWLTMGLALLGAGIIVGIAIGLSQALVLHFRLATLNRLILIPRRPVPSSVLWFLSIATGATVGWYMTLLLSVLLSLVFSLGNNGLWLSSMVGGIILGGFQWWLLRKRLPSAIWFVPANGLAVGVGAWLGWLVSSQILYGLWPGYESDLWSYPEAVTVFTAGVVGILAFGVISSLALVGTLSGFKID